MQFDGLTIPVPEIRRRVEVGELDWTEDQIREYAEARAGKRRNAAPKKPCKSCGGRTPSAPRPGRSKGVPVRVLDAPRKACPNCCRKHLGQAIVLLDEARNGYPDHLWIAIGHLAEAQAEIDRLQPDTAMEIHRCRKSLEENMHTPVDLLEVIRNVTKRLENE